MVAEPTSDDISPTVFVGAGAARVLLSPSERSGGESSQQHARRRPVGMVRGSRLKIAGSSGRRRTSRKHVDSNPDRSSQPGPTPQTANHLSATSLALSPLPKYIHSVVRLYAAALA